MPRFGLIGKNIDYSFSRGYFSKKFKKLGLQDHTYVNFDLPDLSQFPDILERHPDIKGLNVTIPYKEAILPYLNELHPEAEAIGAVNTIAFTEGGTIGYNTDITGFRESLVPLLQKSDRHALILGTGGSSKAVGYVLQKLGISVSRVSRTPADGQLAYSDLEAPVMNRASVVVQCTPLGTHPQTDACPPIPYDLLGPEHLLYDLVYNPPLTRFLKEGTLRGCRIKNGKEMLELQAEAAWGIWNT